MIVVVTSVAKTEGFPEQAGVEYAEFVAVELAEARATKASLEQRALGLVSVSGAFVTALFGLIAFLTRTGSRELPSKAELPVYISLGLFVAAALLALIASAPGKYRGVTGGSQDDDLGLETVVRTRWGDPPATARRRVALTRLVILDPYKSRNTRNGRLLIAATVAQAGAVLALAVAVALVLHLAN